MRAKRKRRGTPLHQSATVSQKDPADKKKWIVDEEAVEIVKRIFALCIAGKGPMQIAKLLTAERVLTVKAHYAQRAGKPLPENPCHWDPKSVAGILERPEYTAVR